ncbi:hypothetical protein B0H14DRAFT_1047861 [Mycena olivaceomarginata]|nr:hypothetical protein B0H14DRAFT_1047861 [Mycena olivaceomarginata]
MTTTSCCSMCATARTLTRRTSARRVICVKPIILRQTGLTAEHGERADERDDNVQEPGPVRPDRRVRPVVADAWGVEYTDVGPGAVDQRDGVHEAAEALMPMMLVGGFDAWRREVGEQGTAAAQQQQQLDVNDEQLCGLCIDVVVVVRHAESAVDGFESGLPTPHSSSTGRCSNIGRTTRSIRALDICGPQPRSRIPQITYHQSGADYGSRPSTGSRRPTLSRAG